MDESLIAVGIAVLTLVLVAIAFKNLFGGAVKASKTKNEFARFADKYKTLEEVTEALRKNGVESSNLILGIDYTKSNETQGTKTFFGRCLHEVSIDGLNPYQHVISTIGRTLESLDDDKIIPAFGFGDVTTRDYAVFSLLPDRYCNGLSEVLEAYSRVTPHVKLSGPTNFAPIVQKAIEICTQRGRAEYHILVIIADGQVVNERETQDAIVQASNYPISIIMVGVGDGPWAQMEDYDDQLPARKFDNFQFVNYSKVMQEAEAKGMNPDVCFAVSAMQEIPDQYAAIKALHLLGAR